MEIKDIYKLTATVVQFSSTEYPIIVETKEYMATEAEGLEFLVKQQIGLEQVWNNVYLSDERHTRIHFEIWVMRVVNNVFFKDSRISSNIIKNY